MRNIFINISPPYIIIITINYVHLRFIALIQNIFVRFNYPFSSSLRTYKLIELGGRRMCVECTACRCFVVVNMSEHHSSESVELRERRVFRNQRKVASNLTSVMCATYYTFFGLVIPTPEKMGTL